MVPRHLVTILPGENHQHQQNLSSAQPWLLRNVDSGSSQAMHSKQRQTTDSQRFPQKGKKTSKSLFVFLHLWILTTVPACATHTLPLHHLCNVSGRTWIISDGRRHTSRQASDRVICMSCSWLTPTCYKSFVSNKLFPTVCCLMYLILTGRGK